jgi:hypothetical protein
VIDKIINSNPKLKTLSKSNPRLKWIIANEYQRQVRDRIKFIESNLSESMSFSDVTELARKLNMIVAAECDRILIAFVPPSSMFDMSNAAISALHRLIKPKAGNMMMIIDRAELIIYRN